MRSTGPAGMGKLNEGDPGRYRQIPLRDELDPQR
jgi:hypothetical protein